VAKRKTIGRDPLAKSATAPDEFVAAAPLVAAQPLPRLIERQTDFEAMARHGLGHPERTASAKAWTAVGGRLDIIGGDIAPWSCTIWRFGERQRLGFVAPTGTLIDLETELDKVAVSPDRHEHRVLAAVGWAWVLGSVGGLVGLVAGGAIRLLQPRRMILELKLFDGRRLVARTDHVTAGALEALANGTS
jgi:hypothetical protein